MLDGFIETIMVTIMEHFRTGKQVKNALESELQEILMAMQHVCSKGFRKIMIEQDCKKKKRSIYGTISYFTSSL